MSIYNKIDYWISVITLAYLVVILLKISGFIGMSWFYITLPIWLSFVMSLFIGFLLVLFIGAISIIDCLGRY